MISRAEEMSLASAFAWLSGAYAVVLFAALLRFSLIEPTGAEQLYQALPLVP
jgi:uncharacterized membrane protein